MAFLCVIALTHYDIATEIDHDIEKEMEEADEGVKMLFKMISKVNGDLPIRPVRPELIFQLMILLTIFSRVKVL